MEVPFPGACNQFEELLRGFIDLLTYLGTYISSGRHLSSFNSSPTQAQHSTGTCMHAIGPPSLKRE